MMSAPEKDNERLDDSLADVSPSPIDEEQLSRSTNLGLGAAALSIAGGGLLLLIAGTMTPCMGATRSTKLEWESRMRQIEQAERDAQVDSPAEGHHDGHNDLHAGGSEQD